MIPDAPRATDTGTVDADNPWPGLAAFREADQRYFQGRETVVDELLRIVVRSKLTVLHGVSGLGKTSLLRAGLFPLLRTQHVMPVYVRLRHADDSADLVAQVQSAIDDAARLAAVEAPPRPDGATLWESFHRKNAEFWDARNRIVMPLLVFDQFEEIFTLGRANAARRARTEAFLDELCDLVEGRAPQRVRERFDANPEEALQFSLTDEPCKVLLSLREDFLSELTDLRPRMPAITNKMYRLRPMTTDEALRVVAVGGRLVDRRVAERIVQFVGAAGSETAIDSGAAVVEPALLSVFCRELNNKRRDLGQDAITEGLLEGSSASIIRNFYERTISADSLSPEVRIFVEEDLITESGFRDSVAEEQALATRSISRADIDALITSRLLRREDVGTKGRSRLELTHDVLANAIRVSRDQRRMREQQEREVAAQQAADARVREDAERAREAAERERVSREEQRAREAAERIAVLERRGRRRQLAWSSVILVLVGTLGLYSWQKAVDARRALSAANLDRAARGEPRALAYLARAVRDDPTSAAARTLLLSLLSRQIMQLAQLDHGGPLRQAAIDAAGTRVLTRGEDGVVRLWNARTGQPIQGELGPARRFAAAALSADGSRIVTVTGEGRTQLWDAATGTPRGDPLPLEGAVSIAAFDSTGKRLVTVADRMIALRDVETGAQRLIDAQQPVTHAALDPTGTYLLSISSTADATLWLADSGSRLAQFPEVAQAAFNGEGTRIVAAFFDGTVKLIETASPERVVQILERSDPFGFVGFDLRAERVITASSGTAQVWSAGGTPIGKPLQHAGRVLWAGFSPDGERVMTASDDGTARIWDAGTGHESGSPLRHGSAVVSAAFSDDGSTIVTAAKDGTARVWDARTGVPPAIRLRHPHGRIGLAALSHDGTYAATAGALDVEQSGDAPETTAHIWEIAIGRELGVPLRHARAITSLAFDRQGMRLVTTSDDHTARIWDVRTGAPVGAALQHAGAVVGASFSADGDRVVTASDDGTAAIWDAATGSRAGELRHDDSVVWAAFSPNRQHVITASKDGTVRVWTAATGAPTATVMDQKAPVTAAALNADGSHLVTLSDQFAMLWDVRAGRAVSPRLDDGPQSALPVFSTSGREVITMPLNVAAAFVRDVQQGARVLGQLRHDSAPSAASSSAAAALVTAAESSVHFWDVNRRIEIGAPLRHGSPVGSVEVSADGSRILVVESAEGIARIWDVMTGAATDADVLAELAEVIGGFSIDDASGELTEMPARERQDRLAALRERANRSTSSGSRMDLFMKWLLADPATRTVSPFSTVAVTDYVQRLISEGEAGRREAQRWFPGHPALARTTGS
jgi:WD40 repeat protein